MKKILSLALTALVVLGTSYAVLAQTASSPVLYTLTIINQTTENMCARATINADTVTITPPDFLTSCVPVKPKVQALATSKNGPDVIAVFMVEPQWISIALPNSSLNYKFVVQGCPDYGKYQCDLKVTNGNAAVLTITRR